MTCARKRNPNSSPSLQRSFRSYTRFRPPSAAAMRLLLLVSLAAATAVAQTVIDYSKVPDCARQCTVLGQAETGCVPSGGAPVTDQNTYQSCFCQSALLTTLKTSGALCQSVCSPDDATKISQFYVSLCNGPVQPAPAATTTVATTTPSTATTSTQTGGTTNGATAGNNVVSSTKKSWYANLNSLRSQSILYPLPPTQAC